MLRLPIFAFGSHTSSEGRQRGTDLRPETDARVISRPASARRGSLALCAALSVVLATPATAQDGRAQRGQTFARANCASCHAIGRVGDSPLAIAPAFRTLHRRYPVENLAEALAEGITTGHPTMPEFRLDPAQISDLIAYLRTLEH